MKKTGIIDGNKAVDAVVLSVIAAIIFVAGILFGGATPQGKNFTNFVTHKVENVVGK
jgi:hypothetical protein